MSRRERVPVSRAAVDRIQAMIAERGLVPGDALPAQRELAEELGISRASLREALSTLDALGVVIVQPARGVFVADPAGGAMWRFADRCQPRDIYQARYCIEAFAASLAAERIDEAHLARLSDTVADLRAAFAADDIAGMAKADSAFHDIVIHLCGNPMIAAMYRTIREVAVESQRLPMVARSRLSQTVAEHETLLAALAARDGAAARDAMRLHIRSSAARLGVAI